jgi:hypothetical protein
LPCYQVRAAHCMVRLHNTTQNVDSNLCEDAGLPKPHTLKECGMENCPHWVPSDWSPCEESRCFTWNTGRLLPVKLVNSVFHVKHILVRPVFSALMSSCKTVAHIFHLGQNYYHISCTHFSSWTELLPHFQFFSSLHRLG